MENAVKEHEIEVALKMMEYMKEKLYDFSSMFSERTQQMTCPKLPTESRYASRKSYAIAASRWTLRRFTKS